MLFLAGVFLIRLMFTVAFWYIVGYILAIFFIYIVFPSLEIHSDGLFCHFAIALVFNSIAQYTDMLSRTRHYL